MSTSNQNSNPWNSNTTTMVLVIIFACQFVLMGWYTYASVQEQLAPEKLVQKAEKAVEKNYPALRKTFKSEIKANADEIAESLSQAAIDSAPDLRKALQQILQRNVRQGLDVVTELSADEFKDFVKENRERIESLIKELEDSPEIAQQTIRDFEQDLDEVLGVDLEKQAKEALIIHRELNQKLAKLNDGNTLDAQGLLEKRIVRILKTLEEERLPEIDSASADLADQLTSSE